MSELSLYTYYRSSAAYRVRIALHYKSIPYQSQYIHLLKEGGQEKTAAYQRINPQKLIPSLVDDGNIITQSLAIIEYLEEQYPEPPLLPGAPVERGLVRALAHSIACDIHPLNNLRVMNYLEQTLGIDKPQRDQWICHWISEGFAAIEKHLSQAEKTAGKKRQYCWGNEISLADVCLIPQVYNAKRFHCPLEVYPNINRVYKNCMELAVFHQAAPESQDDNEL